MKPRLLIVPHLFATDIRIRGLELARHLTDRFEVYCLQVPSLAHVHARGKWERRSKQVAIGLKAIARPLRLGRGPDGLVYVSYPHLDPALLARIFGSRASVWIARKFNGAVLQRAITRIGATHVLLESSFFAWDPSSQVKLFLDIVDWFPEEKFDRHAVVSAGESLRRHARSASAVFAVSSVLAEKLKLLLERDVVSLPNGADVRRLRTANRMQVEVLRQKWGLEGKFVVSSIGKHGKFSQLDFAIAVFQAVRQLVSEAVLLVVGPCDDKVLSTKLPGVIFTGQVSPDDVDAYFHLTDVGLLTQEKSGGTDYAFQIKMVEYSICRKFVLSTPLEVWRRLRWPNVILMEQDVSSWARELAATRYRIWNPEWDRIFEKYDWDAIANSMAAVMSQ